MILVDVITFLKIGSNIILAVLGFISFEDVYQPNAESKDSLTNQSKRVNCVELIPQTESGKSKNIYYANWIYFTYDKKSVSN